MSKRKAELIALIDLANSSADKIASVAELSRRSGVSRTALYKYYRDVIQYMSNKARDGANRNREPLELKLEIIRKRWSLQRQENKALARACAHLIAELVELRLSTQDLIDEKDLRIRYLEEKLRSEGKGRPKIIK
ncbi:TPA: hypothetical protein NIE97_005850 [Pseudomonas aeruginosa]|nr:hypothetical protein [Pseudomonas aeruginosa]HBN9797130.1 hypothetical protein [Pseudomonas aeruginosa]HCF4687992.1 hypothetical protein [Pseudomonas aeruginosa]HCF4694123.1 hypothetical protein [Pseudomonas aeruginosa]HCR1424181.1 hypothetical protein [Pseudomonas aeruginosa]